MKRMLLIAALITFCIFSSCSKAFLTENSSASGQGFRLVISGNVFSETDYSLQENASLTFRAYSLSDPSSLPIATQTAYTSSNGKYTIVSDGFSEAIKCIITASAPPGCNLKDETQEISVTWEGPSMRDDTFFVNTNFTLHINR